MYILALLLFKHFLADFPLQTPYMVTGKGKRRDWVAPLLAHAAVHGALTFVIFLAAGFSWLSVPVATAEMLVHATIDRVKAHPDLGGRWNPTQPQFWWALGADQLAHNACYLAVYWYACTRY